MAAAPRPDPRRMRRTALVCAGVACAMVGASFAAVPLYDLFCKVTGFGGTPMVGTAGAARVLDRVMTVDFDSNVAPGLNWRFQPEAREVSGRVGTTQTVFYRMTNQSDRPVTAVSTFNVTPEKAAAYFVKLQCFCFTEHTLQPGESFEAPVVFYIDPEIETNRELDGIGTITLSYTYFPSKNGQPVAEGKAASGQGDAGKPRL